jgi:hypothetical protein
VAAKKKKTKGDASQQQQQQKKNPVHAFLPVVVKQGWNGAAV